MIVVTSGSMPSCGHPHTTMLDIFKGQELSLTCRRMPPYGQTLLLVRSHRIRVVSPTAGLIMPHH